MARLQPVRDHDLIVTLLSPERGRVDTWVHSGRKSTRRFGGRIEPFVFGRAGLKVGRGKLPALSSFERQGVLVGPGPTYRALCLASYVAELASNALQPEISDPGVYRWALNAIAVIALEESASIAACKLSIEIGFLAATGHLVAVDHCIRCRGGLSDGACWPSQGDALVCPSCAPHDSKRLDVEQVAAMVGLFASIAEGTSPPIVPDVGDDLLSSRIGRRMEETLPYRMRTEQALHAIV